VQQLQRTSDERVRVRGVPGGRRGVRAGEPGAQRRDQQQVEQPVQHRLLARFVPPDLRCEQHVFELLLALGVNRVGCLVNERRQFLPLDDAITNKLASV
jgi:hypothetical protein